MRYPRVFSRTMILVAALAMVAGVGVPLGAASPAVASSVAGGALAATDISVGADGAVWALGTNPATGGYGLWHWNGAGWAPFSGGGVAIAVDPRGRPWVVNSARQIYDWTGTAWVRYAGAATDISVGADGAVWVVGTNPTSGGYGLWHWNGAGWAPFSGGGVTIAVDRNGRPWVVNSARQIYNWTGTGWVHDPGAATDISVGADGAVWVVGTNPTSGGYGIRHWNGTGWAPVPGIAGVTIAAAASGYPYVLDSNHQIHTIGSIALNSFSSTPSLSSSGGGVSLSWSTANALSCTIGVMPAVAGLPLTVPCSAHGANVILPANPSPISATYTFTLTAAGPASTAKSAMAVTTLAGFAASASPVSTSTTETPDRPAGLHTGQRLAVTFDQAVTVAPTFALTLTDGINKGTVDNSNASVSYSNSDKTVTFTLTAAPNMVVGGVLAGVNLQVLAQSGVSDSAGPWNLLTSGEVNFNTNASPSTCTPINSRVFGGTNCLNFGSVSFGGPDPTTVYDVIARPTYDLPGSAATSVTRNGTAYPCLTAGCDAAPEVITNCSAGSTDSVYDLTTGTLLGADPCGTWGAGTVAGATWPGSGNEGLIGNTTGATLDYIPTPSLQDYEQVGVIETVPNSLWVSGTAVPPQIVSASPSGGSSVTFTFDTPVTCPAPATLSAADAANEAAQFFWYTDSAGVYANHHATSITCPPAAGGASITATFTGQDIPPSGMVTFKFEGFGIPLIPTGGTGSPFVGEREASQSFETNLG